MVNRNILCIEDLIKFCETNQVSRFSTEENGGYRIKVNVPATFEEVEADDDHRGMMRLKFRVFHTGKNRNGSMVSEDSAKAAMPTIKNRPIMAHIHQLDSGEWDFEGHNMELVQTDDDEYEIVYIEKQVGSFDESEPFFEYDEELDKTYVCAYGYISEEYTKACEIIRRKGGTKNSVELSIEEFAYNNKEKCLDLKKFYVSASTLLGAHKNGEEIGEGMLGSRADEVKFSIQTTPESSISIDQRLIDTLDKLNNTLSNFNIDTTKKGGNAVENLEVLEEVTVQNSEEDNSTEEVTVVEESTATEDDTPDVVVTEEEVSEEETEEVIETEETEESEEEETVEVVEEVEEVTEEKFVKSFELSHDDIRYALYQLLRPYEESDNTWYYISNVYDTYFVYSSWDGQYWGQAYTKNNEDETVAFDGERYELFMELLTASEKAELDSMRSNYELIQSKLETYQKAEEKANKDALFVSEEYASIADKEEFAKLKNDHEAFSVDELRSELDKIILNYAKGGNLNFAAVEESKKIPTSKKLPVSNKATKKSRYGSLKFN